MHDPKVRALALLMLLHSGGWWFPGMVSYERLEMAAFFCFGLVVLSLWSSSSSSSSFLFWLIYIPIRGCLQFGLGWSHMLGIFHWPAGFVIDYQQRHLVAHRRWVEGIRSWFVRGFKSCRICLSLLVVAWLRHRNLLESWNLNKEELSSTLPHSLRT